MSLSLFVIIWVLSLELNKMEGENPFPSVFYWHPHPYFGKHTHTHTQISKREKLVLVVVRSFRGPKFASQHQQHLTTTCNCRSGVPEGLFCHPQTRLWQTVTHTYTNLKISLKKKKKDSFGASRTCKDVCGRDGTGRRRPCCKPESNLWGLHGVEGENHFLQVALWLPHCGMWAPTHKHCKKS